MSQNDPLQFHPHSLFHVYTFKINYIPSNMYSVTALAYLVGLAASMPLANTGLSLAANNVAVYWGTALFYQMLGHKLIFWLYYRAKFPQCGNWSISSAAAILLLCK